jgi:putative ABC transport system permease protein
VIVIYRWLLRWMAPTLARDYAAAMEETLIARWREARDGTLMQRARFWGRELAMLAALGWSERFGEGVSGRRRRRREFNRFKAGPMDTFAQELHQALRRLWRSPAFTTASVLTLALAIGANAAIFAVVERVVLNPLPYPESDRLITLDHGSVALKVVSGMETTPGLYLIYKNRSQSLASAAIWGMGDRTLLGRGEPERLTVSHTTPSLAAVLRVQPAVGRWFTEDEGRPGGPKAVVLSHGLWTRRFGRSPAVVGESLVLDGQPFEVVGVMPAGFAYPFPRVEVWTTHQVDESMGFGLFGWSGVARLRDGVSLETARAELQGLIAGMADAYPDDPRAAGNVDTRLTFVGVPLKTRELGNVTRALWILLVAVGVVLLVACANVANLFLVRAELHQREAAVRRALGASSARLGRYFFTESVLLASAGGTLGTFIAWGALQVLVQAGPNLPRLHEIRLHPIALGYIAVIAFVIAGVFGALPLWRSSSMAALHETGRGNTTTRQRHRARQLLLGAQVAMALVLLVASGLMVRSFINLRAIDPGFNPESTLTFRIGLPPLKYQTVVTAVAAHHAIIERLTALPGATAAAGTTCLPLSMGCNGNTLLVEGQTYPPGTLPPLALYRAITGGYLEAMGMRILRGRAIERGDVDRREPVAVISQTLARTVFKDQDPIGKRVASNQPPPKPGAPRSLVWLTVVGVVTDVPMRALNETPMPMLYMPLSHGSPAAGGILPGVGSVIFVIRSVTPPEQLVPAARAALQQVDPDLALSQVSTLQELVDRASAQMTFTMVLLAIAAGISLFLGVIGIYGVTSYIVTQRTSEIGVRLALGAEPSGITRQIVAQGGLVAFVGIAVGLTAAFAGGQLIASVLYGVSPRDPMVLAVMAVTLQLVALAACWIPARRAARLDPTIALRAE